MSNIKGLRWYKTDLHLHTKASKCFEDDATAEEWVDECLKKGLECIAVTDHNSGDYIDTITKAAEGKNLTIFPGVEVTCGESKVHLLVLFDIGTGTEKVNVFLHNLGLDKESLGQQDAKVNLPVVEVIERAYKKGAIVIPAHIDQFAGLCEVDHTTRRSIFERNYVYGVQAVHDFFYNNTLTEEEEVKKLERLYGEKHISAPLARKWKNTLSQAKESNLAILTFSDNPNGENSSKHGLWGIGKRYTWIKMDEKITLESLRQALLMSDTRIRNDFESPKKPYSVPDYWIEDIKIKNTSLNSKNQEDCIFQFSPQMTTIIGGRGTGKSSILRFIRGCFQSDKDIELPQEILKDQHSFYNLSSRDTKQGVLNTDSEIEITFNRQQTKYKIKAHSFKSGFQENSIQRWETERNDFVELSSHDNGTFLELFKYDLYSQKQIYEIAKAPNALRNKIDNSIDKISLLQEELKTLKGRYLSKSANLRNMKIEIEGKVLLVQEIEDQEAQLKTYRESDYDSLFQSYNQFSKEANLLKGFEDDIKGHYELIKELSEKFGLEEVDVKNFSKESQSEVEGIVEQVQEKFSIIHANLLDLVDQTEKLRHEYRDILKGSNWVKSYNKTKSTFEQTKEQLESRGVQLLKSFERINTELNEKYKKLELLKIIEDKLETETKDLEGIKKDFILKRGEVTKERIKFINLVLKNSDSIRIDIKQYRDQKNFEKQFRKIIQREETFSDEIKKILEFCFKGPVASMLPELLDKIEKVRKGEEDNLIYGRFANLIRNLNDEQIDELTLLYPEDEIQVKYRPKNSKKFQSLSNASAGQKSSAILTFLLSYGDTPLILDQPEDDLDNSLIYDLIVERLKSCKHQRQLIIVTHNANIPVNGDSEYIIVMNSDTKEMKVLAAGSLENSTVRDEICKVMEGGENAFKLRAQRYNITY